MSDTTKTHPCSLLCSLIKLIFSLSITLSISFFFFWLIYHPNPIKVHVENASLSLFNLTTTNATTTTLTYNLTLDISVRNPNKKISIYYDWIEARAYYNGERFAFATLPTFYQGHKNTTMLYPSFDGQSVVVESGTKTRFNTEKNDGFYNIYVNGHARVRFKVGWIKIKFKPRANCHLRLALSGGGGGGFQRIKCDVDL
ncbi:hypothetical protein QJS10_CPB19g00468 [Acorus calamus]|uniref:Late embryogenesis abundant protein LEA-2 subgroup domain-containing protein n=1 Tax=Acorus calamus TaxID=4465 RepID=A0AAV9CHG3_ACOCL|nr:hypothetical protein QJS10_CPB19g00468 [Acorus calamus]